MDEQVLNSTEISIQQFIENYHPTLSYPAIVYALKTGKISGRKDGRNWIVVINDLTKKYNPIRSIKNGRL